MPICPGLVQDDTGDPDGRIEACEACDHRRVCARGMRDVDDEDHRRCRQFGNVRGRGFAFSPETAIEQAHGSFDDGDVGAHRAVEQQRDDARFADHEGIEVSARPARGHGVVTRIDVVGADLVARDVEPSVRQGRHQTRCDRRLAVSRCWRRDDQSR